MNGLEMVEKVKASRRTNLFRSFMLTTEAQPSLVKRRKGSGCDRLDRQAIQAKRLVQTVEYLTRA